MSVANDNHILFCFKNLYISAHKILFINYPNKSIYHGFLQYGTGVNYFQMGSDQD